MPLPPENPNRFEERAGGGCASLFGLPFFLMGLAIMIGAAFPGLDWFEQNEMGFWAIPFGGIFALVGAGILFGRSGLTIDRETGEIVKWWGLPMPIKRKRYALSQAVSIHIDREIRRSKNSTYVVYPVAIAIRDGKPISLKSPRQIAEARNSAESLSKFLSLPLIDLTEGEAVVRNPDELDLSIKERFNRGSIPSEIPEVPAQLRSQIDFDGQRLQVKMPPVGAQAPLLFALGFIIIFCSFAAFVFSNIAGDGNAAPGGFAPLLWAFAVVFFSIPLAIGAKLVSTMFLSTQCLTATSESIEHSRGWIWRRVATVPTSEIEEIFVGRADSVTAQPHSRLANHRAIVIRSDNTTLRVGGHLPKKEIDYILALLRAIVVS